MKEGRKRKSLTPNTYIKIFQINPTSTILTWNEIILDTSFFKGTDVHRRSYTCIMSEVCILMTILYKNRLDCDVLRPLYLQCRQHLLLYLNRNTSSLPSTPNLSALQIILGLEVQTQFFLHSLSITTTTNITGQITHSAAPVQQDQSWSINSPISKKAHLYNIEDQTVKALCVIVLAFFNLSHFVAVHPLLQDRNIF